MTLPDKAVGRSFRKLDKHLLGGVYALNIGIGVLPP